MSEDNYGFRPPITELESDYDCGFASGKQEADEEIARQSALIAQLEEALGRVEWGGRGSVCCRCGNSIVQGHRDWCQVDAALSAAKAEAKP